MPALVAEHLGAGHRHPGGAALDQRRLVGGRRHHHRPRHARRPEHVVDEVAQLAPALADQRVDHDVGLDAAGEIGEQRRLADRPSRRRPRCAGRARAAAACRRPRARWRAGRRAPCASPAPAAARRSVALAAPGASGRPSSGWPKASTIRPTQLSAGCTPAGAEQRRRVARPPRRRAARRSSRARAPRRCRRSRRRAPARRRGRSPPGRRSARGASARRSRARAVPTAATRPTRRWLATRASSAPSAAKSVSIGDLRALPFVNHRRLSPVSTPQRRTRPWT